MDSEAEPGAGIRYSGNFKCFFDQYSGAVCIGNPDDLLNCESVKFAQNTVAAIRDGKLISVWIKPAFIYVICKVTRLRVALFLQININVCTRLV